MADRLYFRFPEPGAVALAGLGPANTPGPGV